MFDHKLQRLLNLMCRIICISGENEHLPLTEFCLKCVNHGNKWFKDQKKYSILL